MSSIRIPNAPARLSSLSSANCKPTDGYHRHGRRQDLRGASFDIYAQRVDSSGVSQWTSDGVAICTAANDQYSPMITSNGFGGAIITWEDYRNGGITDIYAQSINNGGVVPVELSRFEAVEGIKE